MKLFQLWHADPPADILCFMEAAKDGQPDFDYVRFNEKSGRAFVEAHYGERAVAAWDSFVLPVMYSDFLRLLLMDIHGGVYADASYQFANNLSGLVAKANTAQMPWALDIVNSNYMMFREPGHPFIRACITMLLDNVEHRRFGSTLMSVGPGMINSIRCALSPEERPGIVALGRCNAEWMQWGWEESIAVAERLIEPTEELKAAYRSISLVPIPELHEYASSYLQASHRLRDDYWYKWRGEIFR